MGYVLQQIGGEDLIRALDAVGRGEALLDPAVTQRVFQEVRRAAKDEGSLAFVKLSQQEKNVLVLVSEGRTNREIAKALFLGEGTVRNYVSSILSKLGVSNRAEAAAYAVEHNLKEYIEQAFVYLVRLMVYSANSFRASFSLQSRCWSIILTPLRTYWHASSRER